MPASGTHLFRLTCILLGLLFDLCTASATSVLSWAGALTPTSARLAVRPPGSVGTVLVAERSDLAAPVARLAVTRDTFLADISGLRPDTTYFYGLEGVRVPPGEFKTPSVSPRAPLRVALGSCSWTQGNGGVFESIAALEPRPLAFVHAGDLHYADIAENRLPLFEEAFHQVHLHEQKELFRTMPIMYTWDDHDYGSNNADGSSASKPAAMAAFRKFVPALLACEQGPFAVDCVRDGGIFQAYEIQGVLFILTDLRSQSTEGSTLGDGQRKWLIGLLARWREWRLIVWVSSKPWLGVGGDSWGSYPDERLLISDAIASAGVRNLIMVAGDAHMLAVDDGSNTDFSSVSGIARGNASARAGFPLFQVAPLAGTGSSKSGPYSHGCMAYKFFVNHQFGILDIDDGDEGSVCVTFRGMTATGAREGMLLKTCAGTRDPGGIRGLVRKGSRTSASGDVCALPWAPGGIIAMVVLSGVFVVVCVVCDVLVVTGRAGQVLDLTRGATAIPRMPRALRGAQAHDSNDECQAAAAEVGSPSPHVPGTQPPGSHGQPCRRYAAMALALCHVAALVLLIVPVSLVLVPLQSKG